MAVAVQLLASITVRVYTPAQRPVSALPATVPVGVAQLMVYVGVPPVALPPNDPLHTLKQVIEVVLILGINAFGCVKETVKA